MARPTKAQEDKRIETARFRLTVAERAHLDGMANALGLCLSDFCRSRALGYRLPSAKSVVDDRLLLEINRIGVNLNQIAARFNATGESPEGLAAALDEVHAAMRRVVYGS